jgi:hypothetical protein
MSDILNLKIRLQKDNIVDKLDRMFQIFSRELLKENQSSEGSQWIWMKQLKLLVKIIQEKESEPEPVKKIEPVKKVLPKKVESVKTVVSIKKVEPVKKLEPAKKVELVTRIEPTAQKLESPVKVESKIVENVPRILESSPSVIQRIEPKLPAKTQSSVVIPAPKITPEPPKNVVSVIRPVRPKARSVIVPLKPSPVISKPVKPELEPESSRKVDIKIGIKSSPPPVIITRDTTGIQSTIGQPMMIAVKTAVNNRIMIPVNHSMKTQNLNESSTEISKNIPGKII